MSADEVAAQIAERMQDWETAASAEADQIEAELKTLVNQTNAAVIFTKLRARYQATYLGLQALEQWAATDRKGAVEYVAGMETPTTFQIATALRDWSKSDDGTLLNYATSLPQGKWRDRLFGEMVKDRLAHSYSSRYDPGEAFAMAETMSPGEERAQLLKNAALKISQTDAQAVVDRINQFADPSWQTQMIPYVAIGYASQSPAAAADWLLQVSSRTDRLDAEQLNVALTGVFQTWLDQADASPAVNWIEMIPDDVVRERVRRIFVNMALPGQNQPVQ